MNLRVSNEVLVRKIRKDGASYFEYRRVGSRLQEMLVDRMRLLKQEYQRQHRKVGYSERCAYADSRYVAYVEELVSIKDKALASKIEFETHRMLYQARQTIAKCAAR